MGAETAQTRLIARAPIRICDNGGWSDTWFAGYGQVCHVAITPAVEVRLAAYPRAARPQPVRFILDNYNETYDYDPAGAGSGRHPLLEAAVQRLGLPPETACDIAIHSEAPPGAATGTSAAACVALLAALDALRGGSLRPHQLAAEAHAVETEMLGGQSGIQDQLAAAYGGINWIEMTRFPQASVQPLDLPEDFRAALEGRLLLVYLGVPHSSSRVHEMVIRELEDLGPENARLAALRACAAQARAALQAQDLAAYGRALAENTACQAALHPALVNPAARRLIELAQNYAALGWKVNGAGGEGGSLAILCNEAPAALAAAIRQADPAFVLIPLRLSPHGVQVATE